MRKGRLETAGCVLFLFALNAWICRELFVTEYTRHLDSIEAAYISISRYVVENWRDLTWFPLWYTGVPFPNTYPPLLHLIVAAASAALRISPALAHHAVTAAFYCLGPVTLFWMAHRVSGRRYASFAAALLCSVCSPSALLAPAVREGMGSVFYARRLQALVQFGEGPHITSIALLPIAIVALDRALERRRLLPAYVAAVALAAVVLSNWLGGAALGMAVAAYLLADMRPGWRTWRDAAGIGGLAYVLAGPWIPPTTLLAIRTNAQRVGGDYSMGPQHLLYAAVLALAALALRRLLPRLGAPAYLRFFVLYALFTGTITLAAEWFALYLLPQPHRYHLEMEMAMCLVAAFLAASLPRRAAVALALAGALGAVPMARTYRRYATRLIQPVDMRRTIEYQMARWFDEHMRGRRVMAQGSISFWLNAFTDTPQFGGGFEQGVVNDMSAHLIYGFYANERREQGGEIGVLWLKAYGVHAISMGGPRSREAYRPIRDPDKFRGLLPELWRDGDDAIFGVPQRTDSLARIVPQTALPPRKPRHALDAEPVRAYVAALDDPDLPLASFRWLNRHRIAIAGELPPGHVFSVQVAYHPGWRAFVNGREIPVRKDNLSLLVIDPGFDGPMKVELLWDGGLEMQVLRWLRWCALLAGAVGAARLPGGVRQRKTLLA
jgi:hypothetical protein